MAYGYQPGGSVKQVATNGQHKSTHPDNNCVFPLELGDVLVAPDHLGAVQRPKTAHHFDGALRRVGHLPRFTNGNSRQELKYILALRGGRGRR